MDFQPIVDFIKSLYPGENPVPLHAPRFRGNEKNYLAECIDSTFVSYVGAFVIRFEKLVCDYTGASHAVAMVNGTEALHVACMLAGVRPGDEVITQALTFVATANAISYCGAQPIFVDVDRDTMGLSPDALEAWLNEFSQMHNDGTCRNKITGKIIRACVPMHTLGHPAKIERVIEVCDRYNIAVVEDSAESLGSLYRGKHAGTFGCCGILSFNGNKPVTTGGGGMLITNDADLAAQAKHITTTAKMPHPWEFFHDTVGFNYRMPNINAAIGCAQMEAIVDILNNKRQTAAAYSEFFCKTDIRFFTEPRDCRSNYWLNAVILDNREQRDTFLQSCASSGVQSRPVWNLMTHLPMFSSCQHDNLENSMWLEDRLVNIPSSYRISISGT
jgi:aminotransferase in exopolysaccharide biosynthesis